MNLACFLIIGEHIMIFLCSSTVKKLHTAPLRIPFTCMASLRLILKLLYYGDHFQFQM